MYRVDREDARKVSINRISKYFTTTQFKSEDFGMLSLMRFRTTKDVSHKCEIRGICIVVVCSGFVKTEVNGRYCELYSNSILMLNEESKVTMLKCSKACTGYLLSFSYQFINKSILDVTDSMLLNVKCNQNPCVKVTDDDIERLHRLAGVLSDMVSVSGRYTYDDSIIVSLFTSVFYMFMSILELNTERPNVFGNLSRSERLLKSFIDLLSEACERERSVEYYANELNVSPKYLSFVCKNIMGRGASNIIDEAVIRKSKELLLQSGLSVQDVANRLNFVSQSFFGRYFKQRVGLSPSRYKSQSV